MTKSIQTILTPFLIISYVFGLRIADLPINRLKLWFALSYLLLVWTVYYLLQTSLLITSIDKEYSIEYHICCSLEILTSLLSVVFGIYHNKKLRNCLKKLDIIDDTLLELGTVTDYNKLHKKTMWMVFGWFASIILLNGGTVLHMKTEHDCDILTAVFHVTLRNYFFHVNVIGDLTTTTILEYIGLKFDQINEYLQNLVSDKHGMKHGAKRTWENHMTYVHQRRFSKALNSKYITWTVIHLHLELHKISREIDSIFGTQMTFKMACYFGWLAYDVRTFFYTILIENFVKSNKIAYAIISLLWFSHNVFKFLLINYVCETVSIKSNATSDLINRLSYSTYNVEVREITSQFLLHMIYAPLRFCGIGFFQFGFKFLHRFIISIATVLVIVIQAKENEYMFLKDLNNL